MRANTTISCIALFVCAACLAACSGGGGGSEESGGGGSGSTASTYTAVLADVELTDSRTGQTVDASGLPIRGATLRKD